MTPVMAVIVIVGITCQPGPAVTLVPLTGNDREGRGHTRPRLPSVLAVLMTSALIISCYGPGIIHLSMPPTETGTRIEHGYTIPPTPKRCHSFRQRPWEKWECERKEIGRQIESESETDRERESDRERE